MIADSAGQSLNTSLLRPYLDSLDGSRFQNGANFAIVGSTTLPKNIPFSLNIQLMQFLHFKSRSLELASTSSKPTSSQIIFVSALFLINDLDWSQHCGFLRSVKGDVHKREWIQKRIVHDRYRTERHCSFLLYRQLVFSDCQADSTIYFRDKNQHKG